VCLCAHVDTIVPTWDPVPTTVDGTIVRGLGAVDDKGGVVACLLALKLLHDGGTDLNALDVAVAFVVDEEQGGTGSEAVAAALRPHHAIALEATDLRPGLTEAGGVEAWVHARGELAHGAMSEERANAVTRVARVVAGLSDLPLCAAVDPLLGHGSAEPFQIAGGSDLYAVPEDCRVLVRMQLVPGVAAADGLEQLRALAAAHDATLDVVETYEAFATPADGAFARRLVTSIVHVTGEPVEPTGIPAWTDAHSFHDVAGAEAIVFGPGSFATAHRPDEHIDAVEIVRCATVFAGLLAPASLAALGETVNPTVQEPATP
jgi:acetylornithine deacetylase